MEFHRKHNSMDIMIWKLGQRNWLTTSSMKLHGTARAIQICTFQSSMEFHGISWNCSSQRNWRTPSSMELRVSAKLAHSKFHGIPWNSMELLVSAELAHSEFHGIPWNSMELLVSAKWRTPSSMEFHGTYRVIEFGAPQIPRNSMELFVSAKLAHFKFHRIPWTCSCQRNLCISGSMEFHGIPWNCSCHRNWRTPNSMEFYGTAGVSSMDFHGTYCLLFNGTIGTINTLSFKMG